MTLYLFLLLLSPVRYTVHASSHDTLFLLDSQQHFNVNKGLNVSVKIFRLYKRIGDLQEKNLNFYPNLLQKAEFCLQVINVVLMHCKDVRYVFREPGNIHKKKKFRIKCKILQQNTKQHQSNFAHLNFSAEVKAHVRSLVLYQNSSLSH